MRLAIITYPRSNGYQYLHETLADMERQDPSVRGHEVCVFVDVLEAPKLPGWVQVKTAHFDHLLLRTRLNLLNALNMQRALRWLSEAGPHGMLLEDDVIFVRGWLEKAIALAWAVHRQAGALPWALKLEHWGRETPVQDQGFQKWSPEQEIWGTQSYIMPSMFSHLLAKMQQIGIDKHRGIYTKTYGDYLIQHIIRQVPPMAELYVANACLTKHVGEISGAYPDRLLGEYTAASFEETDRNPS